MFNFFAPPAAKPLIAADKIDAEYRRMRIKVFAGAYLGYAGYYLVRKNLSLAAPGMIAEGLAQMTYGKNHFAHCALPPFSLISPSTTV